MAKASKPSNSTVWPREGLWLVDAIKAVSGQALWDGWMMAQAALSSRPLSSPRLVRFKSERPLSSQPGWFYSNRPPPADEQRRIAEWERAREACLSPLRTAWNNGVLIAKGRRGDPLAEQVHIHSPASAGWELRVHDWERSIILDPAGGGRKIYDLRFFAGASEVKPKKEPATWLAEMRASHPQRPG